MFVVKRPSVHRSCRVQPEISVEVGDDEARRELRELTRRAVAELILDAPRSGNWSASRCPGVQVSADLQRVTAGDVRRRRRHPVHPGVTGIFRTDWLAQVERNCSPVVSSCTPIRVGRIGGHRSAEDLRVHAREHVVVRVRIHPRRFEEETVRQRRLPGRL